MTLTTETLLLSVAMASAAGLMGAFAVMRRMALASDALSHVALPGIGVALALRVHPALGAMAALGLGAILIWSLEHRTRMPTETIIGVVFSAALAAGSMMASGDELLDVLLGSPVALGLLETAGGIVAAACIIAFVITHKERLVVSLVSADLARTSGIPVEPLELAFLLAFALTVGLGLRYLGVLLMGSLIIIPAASAKYIARSLDGMLRISVALAIGSTLLGEVLASRLHRPSGPLIIAVAASLFFASLLLRPRR
ncbi:MAG TPA: metal ABC transporter permease [Anaeromyxobacteraceae bacterium]|nr:metal ABC transporter permease [Anaeromyxobacteraceae bacterium]